MIRKIYGGSHIHRIVCAIVVLLSLPALAQGADAQQQFAPIPRFEIPRSPIEITQAALPREPFSVDGETGAIFGQQDGTFELWCFPIKMLANVHLVAELADYPVPIDLNAQAATIAVSPDHTTITYSHAAITVKQHMFVTRTKQLGGPGAVVLFEINSVRPATLTLQFQPIMQRQWPAPNFALGGLSWMKIGDGGGYVLPSDNPRFYGAVAMPNAQSGILAPYQERPKYYPAEFKLRFDPRRDSNVFFPLIAILSDGGEPLDATATQSLAKRIVDINAHIRELYDSTRKYYDEFLAERLGFETPDKRFDQAMRWAEISIDQMKAVKGKETGLVAGWYTSGDSARPGFGWFFGRDTLWSLYAIHSYGDFGLARQALEFLIARQRQDGKIMHEYTQTADLVDWANLPYQFAAADSSPLFVMIMEDYVRNTGDVEFVRKYWDSVKRAYQFTRSHDSDGDGIYDNSEGTGWVESWPQGMPNQELYLAALDQQSCDAMSRLAALLGDAALSASAHQHAEDIQSKLAKYRGNTGIYAFSKNKDGSLDMTPTVFPTVAWWTGNLRLPQAEKSFDSWASSDLSTDWGLRAVGHSSPLFDPISYHQGSVWPLFTGWASLAEYRTGRTLSAYEHFRQNMNLTWLQDPGAATELLSGEFYEPLGRSTAHQLWSSAMILSPAIRGLFGVEADVIHKSLRVAPALPPTWKFARLHNVPYGDAKLDVAITRRESSLSVQVTSPTEMTLCLSAALGLAKSSCTQPPSRTHDLTLPLPPVELYLPEPQVMPGAQTTAMKVVSQSATQSGVELTLEAPAGSVQQVNLSWNTSKHPRLTVNGGELSGDRVTVKFPEGNAGWVRRQLSVSW